MAYPYLLFDADNTLFDFDAAERNAHLQLCRDYHLAFSEEGYQLYHQCNAQLWHEFDLGRCTKEFLLVERFRRYLAITGEKADPEALNVAHLKALGGRHPPAGGSGAMPAAGRKSPALPSHQRRSLCTAPAVRPLPHRSLFPGSLHLRGDRLWEAQPGLL